MRAGFPFAVIFCVLAGSAAAVAQERPPCAGPVEVSKAPIVRVEGNGALILRDGRAAMLEGIRLPQGAADHAPGFYADQALADLRETAVGRDLVLTTVRPKEDRYGRIRVQAFGEAQSSGDMWLQTALLRRGLARVDLSPDRGECAAELYAAEAEGRAARAGIWASSAYAVRDAGSTLGGDTGTFQIVAGKVVSAEVRGGRAFLDFGADYRRDFTATIAPPDMKSFRAARVDPRGFAGRTVRLRGFIESYNGPEIELSSPFQIEIVK